MPRIAVTGHMNLTSASAPLVYDAIRAELAAFACGPTLIGISCIARGADSIFARAVLDSGGQLEVVLPSNNYRQQKVKPDHIKEFDGLIERAVRVHVLPFDFANRDAYKAANETLLEMCERLFAVWDGERAIDKGSTASVVHEAQSREIPVHRIWPDGAARD